MAMRLASMMLGASMANVISTERPFPACPRGQVMAKYFIVMVFISFISIITGMIEFVKLKDCKMKLKLKLKCQYVYISMIIIYVYIM